MFFSSIVFFSSFTKPVPTALPVPRSSDLPRLAHISKSFSWVPLKFTFPAEIPRVKIVILPLSQTLGQTPR